jgi:hypothetical protein
MRDLLLRLLKRNAKDRIDYEDFFAHQFLHEEPPESLDCPPPMRSLTTDYSIACPNPSRKIYSFISLSIINMFTAGSSGIAIPRSSTSRPTQQQQHGGVSPSRPQQQVQTVFIKLLKLFINFIYLFISTQAYGTSPGRPVGQTQPVAVARPQPPPSPVIKPKCLLFLRKEDFELFIVVVYHTPQAENQRPTTTTTTKEDTYSPVVKRTTGMLTHSFTHTYAHNYSSRTSVGSIRWS